MKNLMSTAALSLTLVGASSAAFADLHLKIMRSTCAEFMAMDLASQQDMLRKLTFAVEGADRGEFTIGDVAVHCNGHEDSAVAQLLDGDA